MRSMVVGEKAHRSMPAGAPFGSLRSPPPPLRGGGTHCRRLFVQSPLKGGEGTKGYTANSGGGI
jgi:hypothetical protein